MGGVGVVAVKKIIIIFPIRLKLLLYTYVLKHTVKTGLQNIQLDMHRLGYDSSLNIRPKYHKYLDKDLNTFDLYKLCPMDILN